MKMEKNGTFMAFGKIGELIYEKKLSEWRAGWEFFSFLCSIRKRCLSLPGSNKARRRISFHQRSHTPQGTVQKWKTLWTIQSILSSKGLNYLTESDLIKEEGFFDEDGLLADEQVKFYPKTQDFM